MAQHLALLNYEILVGSRFKTSASYYQLGIECATIEWENFSSIKEACSGVDIVIHAAGMNAQDCYSDPESALYFNGVITARLIRAAIDERVKKFIYLSTAHIYGAPLCGVISETKCPQNLHPYATSHLAGEQMCLSARQQGKIEGSVLRLSNAFGAPVHKDTNCWTLLINDLCRQAATTGKLKLRSAGLQRRDFVSLTNVVRAVSHVMLLNPSQAGNGIFNVGGMWAPRVIDVAKLIQARSSVIFGYSPEICVAENSSDEITQDLDYCIDKLSGTGFHLLNNVTDEVDSILMYCQNFFGKNG